MATSTSLLGSSLNYAIQQELNAFFKGQPGTILLRKRFKPGKLASYQMPLIMFHKVGGNEFGQQIGGLTLADWEIHLNVYWYRPDGYGSDPTTQSADTENICDQVRVHFSNYSNFLSTEMQSLLVNYGTKFTLSEVVDPDPLEGPDGLVDGDKLIISSISWDNLTVGTIDPGKVMESEVQNDPPPFPDNL